MKKIQPVNANILIRLEEPEDVKTGGGIIIPDIAREKRNEGVIEAIAPDAAKTLSVGDRVIYKEMTGTEISFNNVKYILVPSDDILAKIVEVDEI